MEKLVTNIKIKIVYDRIKIEKILKRGGKNKMRKTKELLILFISCLFALFIFQMTTNKAYAETKNEVTLNFDGGIIHDGYVEYSKIGKIQLFKGNELVANISNNMTIDLNEADYNFVIKEDQSENTGSTIVSQIVRLSINNKYYYATNSTFKLESSKFNGTLNIKLTRANTVVNTKVENVYDNITSTGIIDLTNNKTYVIDFSKDDELTKGLKMFADLEKTLYYKKSNESLLLTENESEAVIKIVGNKSENKAVLSAVNVNGKKEENFKGLYTKYTGSKLQYDGTVDGVINETRTDYYTKCTYDFTFKYQDEEPKEYNFIEGANQIYIINESKDATFRIDADYSLFCNKVYVDDNLLDSKNYDSKSGSTVITLKDEYLKTLSVGEHTLKVAFSDGKEATTKFEFKEKQQIVNTENDKENISTSPKTGDNLLVYLVLSVVSVIGITTLIIVNNRRK